MLQGAQSMRERCNLLRNAGLARRDVVMQHAIGPARTCRETNQGGVKVVSSQTLPQCKDMRTHVGRPAKKSKNYMQFRVL